MQSGSSLEFDLDKLHSIRKKFIKEGKVTFVFQELKGTKCIKSTYSSTLMIKGL